MPTRIDAHHHYVAPGRPDSLMRHLDPDAPGYARLELEHRRRSLASMGMDAAVVMPAHGYLRPGGISDTRQVNDATAAYRAAHPDLFAAALGIVEPQHGTAAADELKRLVSELGMRGISLHTRFQGCPTNAPEVVTLVRKAAELGLIAFVHAGYSSEESLWRVLDLSRQVPGTPLVVLDGLSGPEQANEAFLAGDLAPDLVFDTAGCPNVAFVTRLIDRVGHERVVFGSNTYSSPAGTAKSPLLDDLHQLTEDVRHAILGENIQRLLS